MRLAVVAAVVAVPWVLHAAATEPGQPLGPGDFVFLLPGFSTTEQLPRGCNFPWCWIYPPGLQTPYGLSSPPIDVEGNQYAFREEGLPNCNGTSAYRSYLVRLRPDGSQEDVAYIEDRCVPNTQSAVDRISLRSARIDNNGGCLLLVVTTGLYGNTSPGGVTYPPAPSNESLIKICGFSTQFDILQTYTPTSGPISFRVPYMPEGFPAADYFDTYYGDLATVGDWSQAQPLQCGYPASTPSVGDYLAVADPLPNPAPGQGRYYVTAVSYQGQRRYGRKSSGGMLSGRDPRLLPMCSNARRTPR